MRVAERTGKHEGILACTTTDCGVFGHAVVSAWWLRQRGVGCCLSSGRYRSVGSFVSLWSDCADDGLRGGPCFRRTLQSRGDDWLVYGASSSRTICDSL